MIPTQPMIDEAMERLRLITEIRVLTGLDDSAIRTMVASRSTPERRHSPNEILWAIYRNVHRGDPPDWQLP